MDSSTQKIFEDVYKNNMWGGSGDGSKLEYNKPFLNFLQKYVKDNNIKTILELGCGDFNLMKHFNFDGLKYFGADIAESIIAKNNKNYRKPNIKFLHEDIRGFKFERDYDLVLIKDVLIHLDNSSVLQVLYNARNVKRLLTVNDYNPKGNNINITTGQFRSLDLNDWPFFAEGECIFEYTSNLSFKRCMLIDGKKMFPDSIL